MKIKKLLTYFLMLIGFFSCSKALNFSGISLPSNDQMIIELDNMTLYSNNMNAMISEKDGIKKLTIRANFMNEKPWRQINMYFYMKSDDLSTKDYRFANDCSNKSTCAVISLHNDMNNVTTENIFTTGLKGGQALVKITDLKLEVDGYIAGYFAAGLANLSVQGRLIKKGSFRIKIRDSMTNF